MELPAFLQEEELTPKKMLAIAAIVVFFVAVVAYLFYFKPGLLHELLVSYGPLGLFVGAIAANATILLPLPIDILVFAVGGESFFGLGAFDPFVLGVLVGIGSAIGEMSGYILGVLGIKNIEKMKKHEIERVKRLKRRISKYGMLIIALAALTPFPFDLVGIAAGLVKFNPRKFFTACAIGKGMRYVLIAYAGAVSIPAVKIIFGL